MSFTVYESGDMKTSIISTQDDEAATGASTVRSIDRPRPY